VSRARDRVDGSDGSASKGCIVPSVEELRAAVAQFTGEVGDQIAMVSGVLSALDQSMSFLAQITSGTNNPKVTDALSCVSGMKQRLEEAIQLGSAAVQHAEQYAQSL
jgi:hypothetical protein